MKKVASILIIGFTSLLMLVVSVIPHHHHHNGNIHFVNGKEHIHYCEHPFSDDHQQEYPENSNCFVHSFFTVCFTDPDAKIKINSPELPDHFQFLSVLPNLLSLKDLLLTAQKKNSYGKYIRHFKLPVIKKSNGLRAPPALCF